MNDLTSAVMPLKSLTDLLEVTAEQHANRGIVTYPLGHTNASIQLQYDELLRTARANANLLRGLDGLRPGSVILLYFESHLDNIVWFWSTVYAGCVPVMLPPLVQSPDHRKKHILHLKQLLEHPICLSRREMWRHITDNAGLKLQYVDQLAELPAPRKELDVSQGSNKQMLSDLALLMLTSGSTGNSKAVRLTHEQILTSISGKSAALPVNSQYSFLNWVGLDHVGSLIEIHLHGMLIGVEQVHVQAPDMISDPPLFLEMIHRHRVARTFAPNFFLAKLRRYIEKGLVGKNLDLSCLRYIVSGGEANVVETCDAVSQMLGQLGAPRNVIVPGFGMTETCAGSIYSLDCPNSDLRAKREFASVGECVPGIRMRISSLAGDGSFAQANEPGCLEISGPIVFNGYYNMKAATTEAFTDDGWFKTGDVGVIDATGKLTLSGRTKEVISINGVKYLPHELETAIEEANIRGVTSSFTVCFSRWPAGAQTEELCVIYLPEYPPEDAHARVSALDRITKTILLHTGSRPYVLPLDSALLSKSTLGKLSRTKLKLALENGEYKAYEEVNQEMVKGVRASMRRLPEDELEETLLRICQEILEIPEDECDTETVLFELGVTSIDLIKLKRHIQQTIGIEEIPMIMMMTNPTIRSLASALRELGSRVAEYDPIVTLQPHGVKTPLWLVHPGVGEVLVFLNLAKFLTDRPVHALRARGFNKDETFFNDISETVSTYYTAIKRQQPTGPYAIAGYSYGSMIAFEVSKLLEKNSDQVSFVGSFNLPPHIKFRMRQLDWKQCLLHLAFFLGLMTEDSAEGLSPQVQTMQKSDAVAFILQHVDTTRLSELGLTAEALHHWADLAFAMQSMATDYEPSGEVRNIDIFYCDPLAAVADNKQQWLENSLSKWSDFTNTRPRFHDVNGAHYTMLASEHVNTFQKTLKRALAERGL